MAEFMGTRYESLAALKARLFRVARPNQHRLTRVIQETDQDTHHPVVSMFTAGYQLALNCTYSSFTWRISGVEIEKAITKTAIVKIQKNGVAINQYIFSHRIGMN